MYKLKILFIGKTKERSFCDAIDEYTKRLRPILSIEWVMVKGNLQMELLAQKEPYLVACDLQGAQLSSKAFSSWTMDCFEKTGGRLAFAIGGADGLTDKTLSYCKEKISLSSLTFPHQMARLILSEQIYRAFEIEKNSPYHK